MCIVFAVYSWVEKLRSNSFELTEKSQTLCGFFSQSSKSRQCVCVSTPVHTCVFVHLLTLAYPEGGLVTHLIE